jgi:hypothetical protein
VLVAAAADLHLALVSIEESVSAEYTGYYGREHWSRDEDDDEEYEAGEVVDRSLILSEWRRSDGSEPAFRDFPFIDAELCPPGALKT